MKTEIEFKDKLTMEQYHVMREKGTEAPFTGKFVNHKENGKYNCAACGAELFSSDKKFDSGTGWPSFFKANEKNIEIHDDFSHGMHRIEVICKKCKSHLGHVFDDAPSKLNGKRFCINSCSLDFKKEKSL